MYVYVKYVVKNKHECQKGVSPYTEGAATLKPREAKVVWARGTDNRLVLEERRERAGIMW